MDRGNSYFNNYFNIWNNQAHEKGHFDSYIDNGDGTYSRGATTEWYKKCILIVYG